MPAKQLSGPEWVLQFPDAGSLDALDPDFRSNCAAFVGAMEAAGAKVRIESTRRPAERAYLMHYAWRIHRRTLNPQNVAPMAGVDIEWVHRHEGGAIDLVGSRTAASAMVKAYGIAFQPALKSLHVEGKAIDMSIVWANHLVIKGPAGDSIDIGSTPRSGMNAELKRVGIAYKVIKHPTDPPHWSTTGR